MSTHVGRNDPCPCGSGLKYKHCHEGKMNLGLKGQPRWVWLVLGLIVVAGVAWGVMRSQTGTAARTGMVMTPQPIAPSSSTLPVTGAAPTPTPQAGPTASRPPVGGLPGATAPQPWQYDPARNQHYDPNHGHWHDGPAPPPEQRLATAAPGTAPGTAPGGPTPAPWTYDQKNNQHWDPNHGHWHPGPPPAEGAR